MAGMFELFIDAESFFRFRLTAPDGSVMAVSKAFEDKLAAVAGIAAVREFAGMGLIADVSPTCNQGVTPRTRCCQRTGPWPAHLSGRDPYP
jgi:uncharacterized protein YegP (UPF0339 family)